ncbi:MAG: FAD-dependent oxidoreductase [Bacteroidetes bacterium]|nr:FAD-dependent oxidoreductase [Bacteroidota bacterium]
MPTPEYSRRQFLKRGLHTAAALGIAPLLAACGETQETDIPGYLLGPDAQAGHLLRKRQFPKPAHWEEIPVIIVGAGISGLSAAYALEKKGIPFRLLELEAESGGNSRAGHSAHTAYPWGAHYLPVPNAESVHVRELLEEMGLITDYAGGLPVFDERALCHAPQERLWYRGTWQKGLIPMRGITEQTREEYARFFSHVETLREARDSQGTPHFAIPLDLSSPQSPKALDTLSLAQYLQQAGYHSPELLWYLDYCCRDDYGSTLAQTSTWAGLHYLAGRRGQAANAPEDAELTWPMGNAHLARYLTARVQDHMQVRSLVYNLQRTTHGWEVSVFLPDTQKAQGYRCRQVIYASPLHTLPYIYPEAPAVPKLLHTPWVVAQLHLKHEPAHQGEPMHWDNVNYRGKGVGYVLANHQLLQGYRKEVTLTYYYPLTDLPPQEARAVAFRRSHRQWAASILEDLQPMHPDIRSLLTGMDIWVWGHGMVAPTPGYLWGTAREQLKQPHQGLHLAHTDVSGISIFEEAQYRGIQAAQAAAVLS